MKNLLLPWLLLSLLWTASAQADISFERFIPVNPTSDFAPTVELFFSGDVGFETCDFVGTPVSRVADSVVVSGNIIRLQIPVHRQDPCITLGVPQISPHTWRYPLLRLPAGNYTLEIVGRNVYEQILGGPIFSITSVPLVIGAGALVNVPLMTGWGLAFLVLMFLTLGIRRARVKTLTTLSLLLLVGSLFANPPVETKNYIIEITLRSGVNRTSADALVSSGLNAALLAPLAHSELSNLRFALTRRPSNAYQTWLNLHPDAVLSRTL